MGQEGKQHPAMGAVNFWILQHAEASRMQQMSECVDAMKDAADSGDIANCVWEEENGELLGDAMDTQSEAQTGAEPPPAPQAEPTPVSAFQIGGQVEVLWAEAGKGEWFDATIMHVYVSEHSNLGFAR